MHLKKSLRTKLGQSTIEYFLLFAVIIGASALSAYVFWPKLRDATQGSFFPKAAARIENADGAGVATGAAGGGGGFDARGLFALASGKARLPYSFEVTQHTGLFGGTYYTIRDTLTNQPWEVVQPTALLTVTQQCAAGTCQTLNVGGVDQQIKPIPVDPAFQAG